MSPESPDFPYETESKQMDRSETEKVSRKKRQQRTENIEKNP